MKNILVISDNYSLVNHFIKTIEVQYLENLANFEFCFSATNSAPEKLLGIGMTAIDLKNSLTCDKIINSYDFIFSIHCKQIFPDSLVNGVVCINFHPGFNPYNRGWYPQVFSIINDKPLGVTIHLMDEYVDHGDILIQEKVEVTNKDTSFTAYKKVIELEKKLISENIKKIIVGQTVARHPLGEGNYNSISDFKSLCALDLTHKGTLGEHLALLRALSHDDFDNAYFIDNGQKIYVSILIRPAPV